MNTLLAVLIPAVFVLGFSIGSRLRRSELETAQQQLCGALESGAKVKAQSIRDMFERVEAVKVADRVMAEWITRHPEDRFDMNMKEGE